MRNLIMASAIVSLFFADVSSGQEGLLRGRIFSRGAVRTGPTYRPQIQTNLGTRTYLNAGPVVSNGQVFQNASTQLPGTTITASSVQNGVVTQSMGVAQAMQPATSYVGQAAYRSVDSGTALNSGAVTTANYNSQMTAGTQAMSSQSAASSKVYRLYYDNSGREFIIDQGQRIYFDQNQQDSSSNQSGQSDWSGERRAMKPEMQNPQEQDDMRDRDEDDSDTLQEEATTDAAIDAEEGSAETMLDANTEGSAEANADSTESASLESTGNANWSESTGEATDATPSDEASESVDLKESMNDRLDETIGENEVGAEATSEAEINVDATNDGE